MNWKAMVFTAVFVIVFIYAAKMIFSKYNVPFLSPIVAGV